MLGTVDHHIVARAGLDPVAATEIVVAAANGPCVRPAFSPQGDLVAYDTDGASPQIYAAAADGTGGPTLLQPGSQVTWGP